MTADSGGHRGLAAVPGSDPYGGKFDIQQTPPA